MAGEKSQKISLIFSWGFPQPSKVLANYKEDLSPER